MKNAGKLACAAVLGIGSFADIAPQILQIAAPQPKPSTYLRISGKIIQPIYTKRNGRISRIETLDHHILELSCATPGLGKTHTCLDDRIHQGKHVNITYTQPETKSSTYPTPKNITSAEGEIILNVTPESQKRQSVKTLIFSFAIWSALAAITLLFINTIDKKAAEKRA